MLSWSVKLLEFNVAYKPREAIKGQALADFVVECTAKKRVIEEPKDDVMTMKISANFGHS